MSCTTHLCALPCQWPCYALRNIIAGPFIYFLVRAAGRNGTLKFRNVGHEPTAGVGGRGRAGDREHRKKGRRLAACACVQVGGWRGCWMGHATCHGA